MCVVFFCFCLLLLAFVGCFCYYYYYLCFVMCKLFFGVVFELCFVVFVVVVFFSTPHSICHITPGQDRTGDLQRVRLMS